MSDVLGATPTTVIYFYDDTLTGSKPGLAYWLKDLVDICMLRPLQVVPKGLL